MILSDVQAFVGVVEAHGFGAAAIRLGVNKTAISRAVQRLERDLGVRLIHRTTRKLSLTEAGQHYFDAVRGALAHIETAGQDARGSAASLQGVIRFAAPDLGGALLTTLLHRFCQTHPGIRFELSLSARLVDLVEEGYDLALRSGRLPASSYMSRRVGAQSSGLYASPDYLARHGPPEAIEDLARRDCVVIRRPQVVESAGEVWRLRCGDRTQTVEVGGVLATDDLTSAREAVRLGMGIGLLPNIPDFTRGLTRLLPGAATASLPINLIWPSRRLEPARVVLFRDFLATALRALLSADAASGAGGPTHETARY